MSNTVEGLRPPAHRVPLRAVWAWVLSPVSWMMVRILLVLAVVGSSPQWDLPAQDLPWLHPPMGLLWALVPLVVGVIEMVAWPWVKYRVYRWEVTETAVYTRVGFITSVTTLVPITRLQDVEVAQGPLDRLLGLAFMRCTTASDTIVVGRIDATLAQQLSDRLLATIGADTSDAT